MAGLPPTLGIRHVALFVSNLERSEAFYRDLLGYQVEWRPDAENVYLTMNGQDNLALHLGAPGAETRLDHFGVMLRRAEDVDVWYERLKNHAVKAPKTHRDGSRSFYFKDPDGNVLQFIHHPPVAEKALT